MGGQILIFTSLIYLLRIHVHRDCFTMAMWGWEKNVFCHQVVWYLVTLPQYNVIWSVKLWSTWRQEVGISYNWRGGWQIPYLCVSTLLFCSVCFTMGGVATNSGRDFFEFWFIFFEYSASITFFGIFLAMLTPNAQVCNLDPRLPNAVTSFPIARNCNNVCFVCRNKQQSEAWFLWLTLFCPLHTQKFTHDLWMKLGPMLTSRNYVTSRNQLNWDDVQNVGRYQSNRKFIICSCPAGCNNHDSNNRKFLVSLYTHPSLSRFLQCASTLPGLYCVRKMRSYQNLFSAFEMIDF